MIFGKQESEIVSLAVQHQSSMTDGVVQYNYETDKVYGASFTTGTIENPANPVIEVFRLPQGESGEIRYECDDCPFQNEDARYDGWEKIYPATREECCIDAYVDNDFSDDFENNFKESVEEQVRDVIDDYIGDVLDKLNRIRIAVSDICEPWKYFDVRQDDWKMRTLDDYVDQAMENGFTTTSCTPIEWVDGEVQYVAQLLRFSENEKLQKAGCLIEDGNLNGALELLQ